MAKEKVKQVPFHESILGALKSTSTPDEFRVLAGMVILTKIPAKHNEIVEALRKGAKWYNIGNERGLKCAIGAVRSQMPKEEKKQEIDPGQFEKRVRSMEKEGKASRIGST